MQYEQFVDVDDAPPAGFAGHPHGVARRIAPGHRPGGPPAGMLGHDDTVVTITSVFLEGALAAEGRNEDEC